MASKILIIDDSKLVIVMLRDSLIKGGYQVSVAYDGNEGLQQVQRERPDLIVLDWHMPVMEGSEFMAELRKVCVDELPPVILLTAGDPDSGMPYCEGVHCCLQKPIDPKQLIPEIEACLKRIN